MNALVGGQRVCEGHSTSLETLPRLQQGSNWVADVARKETRNSANISGYGKVMCLMCNEILMFPLMFSACLWRLFLEYLIVAVMAVVKTLGLAGCSHS